MKPQIPDKPLSKIERKTLLTITDREVEEAIAKTKRSMIALTQSDVQ